MDIVHGLLFRQSIPFHIHTKYLFTYVHMYLHVNSLTALPLV